MIRSSTLALLVLLLAAVGPLQEGAAQPPDAGYAACSLSVSGSPGGTMTFSVTGIQGLWAFYWGRGTGITNVTIGPCTVALNFSKIGPIKFGGPPLVMSGSTFSKSVPAKAKGKIRVQGVDLTACCVTNFVQL